MPHRPPHPCTIPGCPRLVYHGGLCAVHARERAQRREVEAPRLTPAQRGYDARWRKRRAAFLREHPYCADPYQLHAAAVNSTDVDHIISKKEGGTDDDTNLQALCHACHSRKTALEDGRWGRASKS